MPDFIRALYASLSMTSARTCRLQGPSSSSRRCLQTTSIPEQSSPRRNLRRPPLLVRRISLRPTNETRRSIYSSAVLQHGDIQRPKPGTGIKIHFKDSKGILIKTIEANEGDDILSIAHEHDIDLEGACEGSVACSTCHVIVSPEHYDMLPEPEDDENDMLDMAFGLTDTSRLGCQVKLTKALDGITATLPAATRNMFVDGVKPTKH